MLGLIIIGLLLVLCVVFPPLAIIVIPFIILSLITGFFVKSVTKSVTEPIGNDVKWAGERATGGPEPDPEEWDDDSISPALQAAQEEYAEEQTRKSTGAKKIRDNQKSKVYRWENKHLPNISGEELSIDQCEQLIHQAIAWWFRDSKPVMPIIKNGKGTSVARGGAKFINLPKWARNYGVVLHETTHCLIERMKHDDVDGGHGPYFMRTYIELLGYFLNMDQAELLRQAKADKIKVIPMKCIRRPKKKASILKAIYRNVA